ncbi:hypothetical protein [Streptomyces sp. XC 2026]|uniref:hypothetical protein n=1 Tax=Streptomyces sp. XC 2026 TaxID=2782004 RepID=UPI001904A8F1|nr:hypothetical protein [Streptomyces sp. XC 2026]QQN79757.1 hypothetical protein IPZ77_21770 [Streptomyces sp. XC 2026]QQN80635.1 hypothetical protein IPZ77_26885 [Streptomyces sp. XC 2026]
MIINLDEHWNPRTPTLIGHIDPVGEFPGDIDEASTASGRFHRRVQEVQWQAKHTQVTAGMLVVWERAAWRVIAIEERPDDLWPPRFEAAWGEHHAQWLLAVAAGRSARSVGPEPQRATWFGRPVVIILVSPTQPGGKPTHLVAPASHRWPVLPEHYESCVACGELAPCRHAAANKIADREIAVATVRATFPADACMGCGEAIAGRQKAVAFPGPNLWRPDLPHHARFHARQDCAGWVDSYRRAWESNGGGQQQAQLALDADEEDAA